MSTSNEPTMLPEESPPSIKTSSQSSRATARRRQRHWSWALAASVVTLSVWYGSIRLPIGAEVGTALPGKFSSTAEHILPAGKPRGAGGYDRLPLTHGGRRFRVGTFNIHGGRGADGVKSLTRTAACLKDAHFVGLNEVHGRWFWEETDQAEALARRLGRDWLFAPAEERWGHYKFGNGILSSVPVLSWQRIPLVYRSARGYRNAVCLTVAVNEQPVRMLVTHLDRRSDLDRRAQLQFISQLFLALETPAILMGDLNTEPNAPEMRQLLEQPEVVDPLRGLPPDGPEHRIDWILTRGLKLFDRGLTNAGASDHPYYWVDCEVARP
jgi:endonuclease/exonuclease/phosphatase family metal-dependent hydrolase